MPMGLGWAWVHMGGHLSLINFTLHNFWIHERNLNNMGGHGCNLKGKCRALVKSDRKSRLKFETLDALMRVSLCGLPMENIGWANTLDTWKSTQYRRALPLELHDDWVHYVGNLNNFSASFYCMYFVKIVRHHILSSYKIHSIQNGQYQGFFCCCWCEVLQKGLKVWVKCDYFNALHIEMHVHTSNLKLGGAFGRGTKMTSILK